MKTISEEAMNALKGCRAEGNVVYLPNVQLDRSVYMEVKKVFESNGGKWKGGKVYGFVFSTDATDALERIQGGDVSDRKKEFQFYATPEWVADMMVNDCDLQSAGRVLEPSAGDGALIKAIHRENPNIVVDCYELMPEHRAILSKMENVAVLGADFLAVPSEPKYDVIIANPPFAKNQDIRHVRKMYEMLCDGGLLAVLTSPHWTYASDKESREFRDWMDEVGGGYSELPEGAFKESGTNIRTLYCFIKKYL